MANRTLPWPNLAGNRLAGSICLINQGLRSDGRPEYQVKQISQRAGAVALGVGAFDGRKEKQLVVAYAQRADEKNRGL